jgi:phytoene dehydrogenase-like protein
MVSLSPFFAGMDLERFGVRECRPTLPSPTRWTMVGRHASLATSKETALGLGSRRGRVHVAHGSPREGGPDVGRQRAGAASSFPKGPVSMGRFALAGVPSATHLVRRFKNDEAKALMGGVSAHAMLALDAPLTAAFGIFLTVTAHATGWPVVEGGSAPR